MSPSDCDCAAADGHSDWVRPRTRLTTLEPRHGHAMVEIVEHNPW
jgi:hypothetical protein